MPTIDDIRADGEAAIDDLLLQLDARHKRKLKSAIEQYGSVRNIPESVWQDIRRELEEETVAALMLLIIAGDGWTTDAVERQGVEVRKQVDVARYSVQAARQATELAAQTTDTVRDRLERKVTDQQASPQGGVGELTDRGLDTALDDVFTPERRATIAADATTGALTTGQRGAAERGDGARTDAGQRVELEMVWQTERDNLVCPRCAPLHDQPEAVWSKVFPDGPGPQAHPNCRCSLRPVVIVSANQEAA